MSCLTDTPRIHRFAKSTTLADIPEDQSCREWQMEPTPMSSPSRKNRNPLHSNNTSKPKRADKNASKRNLAATESCYKVIDAERQKQRLHLLSRSEKLHQLARLHANRMAKAGKVFHSVKDLEELQDLLQTSMVGENVQRGRSPLGMHKVMMKDLRMNRENLLSPDFHEHGVAAARGKFGALYVCHYFR